MKSSILWRPMPGKVVVEIEAQEEVQQGRIILMGKGADQMNTGKIIAVPDESVVDGQEITPFVKVGDRVVFGKYSGTELQLSSDRKKRIVVMREVDLLTIIENVEEETDVAVDLPPAQDVVGPEPILLDPSLNPSAPPLGDARD